MPAEIDNMISVLETPWHGLGSVLSAPPTTKEAIIMAGLNWTVRTEQLYTELPKADVPDEKEMVEVIGRATVRSDTNEVMGVVGPSYTPLQNEEAFEFFDPFLADGTASIETAGSLRGGRRIWVMAKLNDDPVEIIKDDAVLKYLLLANGHDGSLSCAIGFTPIRVVCQNTLSAALGASASKIVRVRHTRNIAEAVKKIGEIIDARNRAFEATAEQMRELVRMQVDADTLERYVRLVFDRPERGTDEEDLDRETDERKRLTSKVIPLFENGRGTDIQGVRGTMWGAYNAVTEYVSHHRGKDQERRVEQLWFAEGARLTNRAFKVANDLARAAA